MDIKKDVQKQFGRSGDAYVRSIGHSKGDDLKKLVEIADVTGKEIVLDVATGGGHTAGALAPLVQEVTAFDLTPEMLAVAEKFIKSNGHDNVAFIAGDAEELPFEDDAFDLVTCRIAPHHFPNVEKFIMEVYRVLKQGGQFILDDNVAPEDDALDKFYNTIEKKRDYSHFRAWKKTEWLRMLELTGFEINEWYRFEKSFEFESWCDRMKLSVADKADLNTLMLNASMKARQKFHIESDDHQMISFKGEAVLLKAVKPIFEEES